MASKATKAKAPKSGKKASAAPKGKKQSKSEALAELRTKKAGKGKAKVVDVKPYAKEPGEKLPGKGHNSGQINDALVQIFTDYEALEANKKEISKAQRDLRARAKSEFNVQTNVFSDQIRKRKMDADVRAQFEHGVKDLEDMIGYQMSFDLASEEGDDGEGNDIEETEADTNETGAGDDESFDRMQGAMH